MSGKIYYARHGETEWNKLGKVQGKADIELNDRGREQAKQVGDRLKDISFAVIFTSPLKRARETAQIIAKKHQPTPLIVAPELVERDFGSYEGLQKGTKETIDSFDYEKSWDYNEVKMPNGESLKDVERRVFPFLDKVSEEYSGKNVLLVAHGYVGTVVDAYFNGVPENRNMLSRRYDNDEVRIFDIKEQIEK